MKEINLTVEKRDGTGKGSNRRLRRAGEIPAVVYGPETEPIPVKVEYKNLYRLMHNVPLNTIINLDITGVESPTRKVLIRELQKDPVTGELLHMDFHHIPMDKPITLTVPITAVGIPVGVKTFGGIVQYTRREIDISCLPSDIPDKIEVDISELNVGDSVHVSDLELENVHILTDPARTLITVVAPTVIKTAAEEAAEAEAEAEEAAEGEEGAEGEGKPEGEAKEGETKEGDKKEEGRDKK
jgi:large subunit ribosomal protein L25